MNRGGEGLLQEGGVRGVLRLWSIRETLVKRIRTLVRLLIFQT